MRTKWRSVGVNEKWKVPTEEFICRGCQWGCRVFVPKGKKPEKKCPFEGVFPQSPVDDTHRA